MLRDKFIIIRITKDEDDYLTVTTAHPPVTDLSQAKYQLRLIALTDSKAYPQVQEGEFEDYFNLDGTAWGPLPGDKLETRYIIVKLSYGFYSKVIR